MRTNRETSTVVIGGRRFPAATVICPADDGFPDTAWDRSLGVGSPGDQSVYVPAENGVLFCIEPKDNDPSLVTLHIVARACIQSQIGSEKPMWLPCLVRLVDGELVPDDGVLLGSGIVEWRNAEPEWVVETIDRLARKPFEQPPGPLVQLVRYGSVEKPPALA